MEEWAVPADTHACTSGNTVEAGRVRSDRDSETCLDVCPLGTLDNENDYGL